MNEVKSIANADLTEVLFSNKKMDYSYELKSQVDFLIEHINAQGKTEIEKEEIIELQNTLEKEFKDNKQAWDAGFRPFNFDLLLEKYDKILALDSNSNGLSKDALNKVYQLIGKRRDDLVQKKPDLAIKLSSILVSPETVIAKNLYVSELKYLIDNIEDKLEEKN